MERGEGQRRLKALALVGLLVTPGLGDDPGLQTRDAGPVDPAVPGSFLLAQADPREIAAARQGGSSPAVRQTPDNSEQAEPESFEMRSGVPEGFEDYMAPQKTMVDVYFQDRLVTTALAEFTPETIEFENPEEVIRALPDVIGRPVLTNHFRGPLPTHSERVCVRQGQKDCGKLRPEFIGVIFDEARFRVDVFVHPDLLAEEDRRQTTYLSGPEGAGPGLVQNLSLNHSGELEGDDRHSIFGRTRAGLGTQHLFSSWASTSDQDMAVDELGWRKDFRNHQMTLGLYEPDDAQLSVLPRQPILGMELSTSLKRRRDLDSAFATTVEVILDSRSRVELIRDGRLYDASFYEAGNRKLDTTRLPGGAYSLLIRITDSSGNTRTLERFFVKTQRMAPPGERLWFAQLGQARLRDSQESFPVEADTALARGGVRQRLGESVGLGLAGAATEQAAVLETTVDWLRPRAQWHGSLFAGTGGGAGALVRGSAEYRDLRLLLDSQRVWNDPDETEAFTLLPADVRQDRVELRVPVMRGHAFLAHRQARRPGQAETRDTTAGYTRTLRLGGHQLLNVNVSASRTREESRADIGLEWSYLTPHWQHQAGTGYRYSDPASTSEGASAHLGTTWRDGDRFADDVRVSARAETAPQSDTLSLTGEHRSRHGRGSATVSHVDPEGGSQRTLTSAGYDTSLVASPHGAGMGGDELHDAGVVLDLSGAEDARFDVMVDGERRFVARGGRRTAFTLPAYEDYRLSLRDRGTDFTHIQGGARDAVLYPGNVAVASWELQPVVILMGKLVHPDSGEPVGDVLIDGTRSVTATDPDGYFQGEVLGMDGALFARVDGKRCRLALGDAPVEHGVARLGRVPCHPVEDKALPSMDEPAEAVTPR